jgi:hypothetical protein
MRFTDSRLIGFRNSINFEINQSKIVGNRLAAVKLNAFFAFPEELFGSGATLAKSFNEDAIIRALEDARPHQTNTLWSR